MGLNKGNVETKQKEFAPRLHALAAVIRKKLEVDEGENSFSTLT
jgi:hypothetical protein